MKAKIIGYLIVLICGFALAVFGADFRPTACNNPNPGAGKTVTISNFKFTPKAVTVKVGTAVTWSNTEGTHTVTADDGSFQSPNLSAGKSFSHTFTKLGTYRYYCSLHGGAGGADMSGTVTVTR